PGRVGREDTAITTDPAARRRLAAGGTFLAPIDRLPRSRYATIAAYRPILDRSHVAVAFTRVQEEVPVLGSVDLDLRGIAALQAGSLVLILVLVIFFARWLLQPYRRLQRAAGEAPGAVAGLSGGAPINEADELVAAFQGVLDKVRAQESELLVLKQEQVGSAAALLRGDR